MKRKIALGPGAASLILIVVILSLCMLSMLMQIGARNDLSLATRGTEMISKVYGLFSGSEHRLAKLDTFLLRCRDASDSQEAYIKMVEQNLPEGYDMEGDIITWKEPLDRRVLTCSVRLMPFGEAQRTEWTVHTFAEPVENVQEEGFPE